MASENGGQEPKESKWPIVPIPLSVEPIWERQPEEAVEKVWTYFEYYRDVPYIYRYDLRTFNKVCRKFKLTPQIVSQHGKRYRWRERAQAYDMAMRAEFEAERRSVSGRMAMRYGKKYEAQQKEYWERANALLARAAEMLEAPLYEVIQQEGPPIVGNDGEIVTGPDGLPVRQTVHIHAPARWRMRDAAAYIKAAHEVQTTIVNNWEADYAAKSADSGPKTEVDQGLLAAQMVASANYFKQLEGPKNGTNQGNGHAPNR